MKIVFELVFWFLSGLFICFRTRHDPPCPKPLASITGGILGLIGGLLYKYLFHVQGEFTNIDLIASFLVAIVFARFWCFLFLCPPIYRKTP